MKTEQWERSPGKEAKRLIRTNYLNNKEVVRLIVDYHPCVCISAPVSLNPVSLVTGTGLTSFFTAHSTITTVCV